MCIGENWHDFHTDDETFQCMIRQHYMKGRGGKDGERKS